MEGQEEVAVQTIESSGVLNDWFFNMFAATMDLQIQSPTFLLLYLGVLAGLVIVRIYFDDPIKTLAVAGLYIYSVIQSYALFSDSAYVIETTEQGWLMTGKAMWFAFLFAVILVWGMSKVLQAIYTTLLTVGLGSALAYINPLKLLNLLRKSDSELEEIDDAFGVGTAKDPKRQKTAIMMTDIVGFSKAMGADEAGMYKKLQIHNDIVRNQIVRNRGTVIKTIGDAFMVKFRSANNTVQCAMDIQKAIGDYNKTKTPDDQFHVRIGCHMGEVMVTGNDVFGDGVNIAARIEPKADADGIMVSDAIQSEAKNNVPAHFVSVGRLPMKNIAQPPELFKVFPLEGASTPSAGGSSGGGTKAKAPAAGGGNTGGGGNTFKI
ncbi:MAG: adenylate/guanylate cyclase domain-containing protein [Rhodospirillaceae bacterium]